MDIINKNSKATTNNCIIKIIRIKNGFIGLNGNLSNLSDYDYADIKMNVLIEFKQMKMIAEIQFLLKFMACFVLILFLFVLILLFCFCFRLFTACSKEDWTFILWFFT